MDVVIESTVQLGKDDPFFTLLRFTDKNHGWLGLSARSAQGRTGIAAADFSRIRNADLGRFTGDRLMSIINRLGSRVEVKIKVRRTEGSRTTCQHQGSRSADCSR